MDISELTYGRPPSSTLRMWRSFSGLSKAKAAKLTKISYSKLEELEKSEVTVYRAETVNRLFDLYGAGRLNVSDDRIGYKILPEVRRPTFGKFLRDVMRLGIGRQSEEQFLSGFEPWTIRSLAMNLGVSEKTVTDWRSDFSFPHQANFHKLLGILDDPQRPSKQIVDELKFFDAVHGFEDLSDDQNQPIIPEQSRGAPKLALIDGVVDFSNTTDVSEINLGELTRFHQFISEHIADTIMLIPERTNELVKYRTSLLKYKDSLSDGVDGMKFDLFWFEGRKLRRKLRQDQLTEAGRFSTEDCLSAENLSMLEEAVTLHNSFCSMVPYLSTLDARGIDPADRTSNRSVEQAREFLKSAADHPELIAPRVPENLNELLETNSLDPEIHSARDLNLGVDGALNVVNAVLTESVKVSRERPSEFKKSFANASGKLSAGWVFGGGAVIATSFVVTYQVQISQFLLTVPGGAPLKTILDWIVKAVSRVTF